MKHNQPSIQATIPAMPEVTVLLAADLGKSAGRFFYKVIQERSDNPIYPMWMAAKVTHCPASTTNNFNSGDRVQEK